MKCGLSKILRYYPQCLLLLLLVLFAGLGLNSKNAYASIIYDTQDLPVLASSTPCGMAVGTNGFTNVSNIAGYSDNNYATTTGVPASTTYVKCGAGDYTTLGTSPFPVGTVIDSIIYSLKSKADTTSAPSTVRLAYRTGTNFCNPTNSSYTITVAGETALFVFDRSGANCSTGAWDEMSAQLVAGTSNFPNLNIVNTTLNRKPMIDSVVRTTFYHYDTALAQSRLNSFDVSPKSGSGNPYVFTATSSITTTYYYNSADDVATSTKFTRLQYRLYDYFTNQYQYVLTNPITKDITYATSTINNLCSGGLANCANGDTYQLGVRFSNNDASVVGSWFPTSYYFAYIAYTPTPTATTSVIIIGDSGGYDTGTSTINVANLYTDCGLTNIGGCFQNALIWAFVPSSGAIQSYYDFINSMQTKAPMGYFTVVKNNINGLNSTSTPAFSVVIPAHLKTYFFSPFDIGIAGILWFFFAFNFYKRLKHITV